MCLCVLEVKPLCMNGYSFIKDVETRNEIILKEFSEVVSSVTNLSENSPLPHGVIPAIFYVL